MEFAPVGDEMKDRLLLAVCDGFFHPTDKAADRFFTKLCLAERSQLFPNRAFMATDVVWARLAVRAKRRRAQFDAVGLRVDGPSQASEVDENAGGSFIGFAATVKVGLSACPTNFGVEELGEFSM